MNHRPFEDWLLKDQTLNPAQKRELDTHLQSCAYCAALAETGMELRSAHMVSPAPGFVSRFEKRLAARRIAERRRKLWGAIVLILSGLGFLAWLIWPVAENIFNSPAGWVTGVVSYLLFIITSIRALTDVGFVLLRVVPGFIPPFVWMVICSMLAGITLLWSISIWRLTRVPRGV